MVFTQAQKDVFRLYRRGLRCLRHKPESAQPAFLLYLRHAFRSPQGGGGIRKRDFAAIDYMLRRGNKMIEAIYEEKGVRMINVPPGAAQWWQEVVDKSLETNRQSEAKAEAVQGSNGTTTPDSPPSS